MNIYTVTLLPNADYSPSYDVTVAIACVATNEDEAKSLWPDARIYGTLEVKLIGTAEPYFIVPEVLVTDYLEP